MSGQEPPRNGTLTQFCKDRSTALQEIQLKAADFVAKVDIFKAEQTAFRAAVQNASESMREVLESQNFSTQIGNSPNKIALLKSKFNEFANSLNAGPSFNIFKRAMDNLQSSATLLTDTVQTNLALFEDYMSNCNDLLLGTGRGQEYLLDICPQANGLCIERDDANLDPPGHVGCCCGLNPVVSPSPYIDALTSANALGRRLAEAGSVNVCAAAGQESKAWGAIGPDRWTIGCVTGDFMKDIEGEAGRVE